MGSGEDPEFVAVGSPAASFDSSGGWIDGWIDVLVVVGSTGCSCETRCVALGPCSQERGEAYYETDCGCNLRSHKTRCNGCGEVIPQCSPVLLVQR